MSRPELPNVKAVGLAKAVVSNQWKMLCWPDGRLPLPSRLGYHAQQSGPLYTFPLPQLAEIGRQVRHFRASEARPGNLLLTHLGEHGWPVLPKDDHHRKRRAF